MSREPRGPVKIYIGNLNPDVKIGAIEDAFSRFGRVVSAWAARDPPGFAFIEMEDEMDAEDAVRDLNNNTIDGCEVRVEFARNNKRGGRGGPAGGNRDVKCFNCNEYGHWARDCNRPVNRGECYICSEMGHRARECPNRSPGRGRGGDRGRSPPYRGGRGRSPPRYGRGGYGRRSPSPYGRRRSPSPYDRRRSPSPYDRRRSPRRGRSPSPRGRGGRSPSPFRGHRRSPSPHGKGRSPSPQGGRGGRSPSPRRGRGSESPQQSPEGKRFSESPRRSASPRRSPSPGESRKRARSPEDRSPSPHKRARSRSPSRSPPPRRSPSPRSPGSPRSP